MSQDTPHQPPPFSSDSNPGLTRRDAIKRGLIFGAAVAAGPIKGRSEAADHPLPAAAAPGGAAKTLPVEFTLNGSPVRADIAARTTLLDLLREDLAHPGTKKGCDHGQCGACTVHVDGKRTLSCLTLAATVQHKRVTTIEGLAHGAELHPLQAAFIEHDAFQCGFCTPGQLMSAAAFVKEPWAQTDDAIREGMSGNLCRCGAYCGIVAAIAQAREAAAKATTI